MDVLYSQEQIAAMVRKLADQINQDYQAETIDVLIILKGSFVFAADLIRLLKAPVRVHFMMISSYASTESSGTVTFHFSSPSRLENCNVLILEDILDTGITLQFLLQHVSEQKPTSLRTCVLLNKPSRRRIDIRPDYVGFELEDHFVVGYGLDYQELYRSLPYIALLS
jgi:hypoxanthine phosphoribosyltransferase